MQEVIRRLIGRFQLKVERLLAYPTEFQLSQE